MQVLHVDQEGGYIDLSKRTIQLDDIEEKKVFYKKSQMVHLIMRLTAVTLNTKVITCYENFGWDLYDHFEHALDAFKLSLTEPTNWHTDWPLRSHHSVTNHGVIPSTSSCAHSMSLPCQKIFKICGKHESLSHNK